MAALTTITSVREIIDTPLTDPQVQVAINDADVWVSEELVPTCGPTISVGRLELIERYLACALIRSTNDVDVVSVNMGDVREQYQRDPKVTEYLQRAASFDPTGLVRRIFITGSQPVLARVGRRFSHPRHRH